MNKEKIEEATLKEGKYHHGARIALAYIEERQKNAIDWNVIVGALSLTALSGNRTSDICLSTIERLRKGEPVSDRYLMGLAWIIYAIDNDF